MDPCQGCLGIFGGNRWGQRDVVDRNSALLVGAPTSVESLEFETNTSPQVIDSLLAKEMASLSIQEREVVENDVHGIDDNFEDRQPGILDDRLAELDLHLDLIKGGTAYELAEQMSSEYVKSRAFRVMFIRADRYDAWEAAQRMIRFFEFKRELFGEEKLVKDIKLQDLDEDDMESLKAGHHQLSPHKDTAGRVIIVGMFALRKFKTVENLLRATYYVYMASVESEESQRKGVTVISYTVDHPPIGSHHGVIRTSLPVHMASHHFCYNDLRTYAAGTVAIALMTKVQRARLRRHYGNHLECLYTLKSFGIPENSLPVDTSGALFTSYHIFWLESRRSKEQILAERGLTNGQSTGISSNTGNAVTSPALRGVMGVPFEPALGTLPPSLLMPSTSAPDDPSLPGPKDVILGKGTAGHDHPGNVRFRDFIAGSIKQFEQGTKSDKLALAEITVSMVKESGGRFMAKEGGKWKEIGYGATARKRVLAAFQAGRKGKVHYGIFKQQPVAPSVVLSSGH